MCIYLYVYKKQLRLPKDGTAKVKKNHEFSPNKCTESKGMHKKMECKARWGFQHRSNLMVVRI